MRGFALTAAAVRDFGPERCCCLMVTQLLKVLGQVAGRGQGLGVVVAEDTAAPGEGVGVQVPGRLGFSELAQVRSEVAGRDQGPRVVVAVGSAAPGQRIGIQFPGRLVHVQAA